jgi:hypothetical protein
MNIQQDGTDTLDVPFRHFQLSTVAIKHLPFWEDHSHPADGSLGGV